MEENKHCAGDPQGRSKCLCGVVPFLVGVVAALAFGWLVFPDMLFSKQPQPFFFSHAVHLNEASCDTCHSLRADGSFTGLPTLESCVDCHSTIRTEEPAGNNPDPDLVARYEAEKTFIKEYVEKGRQVPWLAHQKQPDNVFFSHAAHLKKCYECHRTMRGAYNLGSLDNPQKLCVTCHPSLEKLDKNPAVETNALTGYSRTTMKMWECEACHARSGHFYNEGKGATAANNACYTCHK